MSQWNENIFSPANGLQHLISLWYFPDVCGEIFNNFPFFQFNHIDLPFCLVDFDCVIFGHVLKSILLFVDSSKRRQCLFLVKKIKLCMKICYIAICYTIFF